MKFINHKNFGLVIFQDHIQHHQMLELLDGDKDMVLGAGFVFTTSPQSMSCFGESTTLQKKATAQDTDRLKRVFE